MKNLKSLILCLCYLNASSVSFADTPNGHAVIVILDSNTAEEFKESLKELESYGLSVKHAYPPHILIADINAGKVETSYPPFVKIISETSIPEASVTGFNDPAALYAVQIWNSRFDSNQTEIQPGSSKGKPLIGDAILDNPTLRPAPPAGQILPAPYGATFANTSEYMIGSVAVSVILVEGFLLENWDATRETQVVSEIQQGLSWLQGKDPNAKLSFTYEFHFGRTDTKYKANFTPIGYPSTEDNLWIGGTMTNLGYSESDYRDKVRHYNNDLRNKYSTNWAYTIFVVDSLNDADGMFSNGKFAYARLGGPYMVMTYDNDGWGISNMDIVTAHETGHIFWALDEYQSAGDTVKSRTGYLDVQNGNSQGDGLINETSCIMRSNIDPLSGNTICMYTRHQYGWKDSNSDGVPDIVDTGNISVTPAPHLLGLSKTTLKGIATVLPLIKNKNPLQSSSADITVLAISNVEYNVNGGSWRSASANDGTFNGVNEPFNIQDPDLSDGTNAFQVRFRDSFGNYRNTSLSFQKSQKLGETVGTSAKEISTKMAKGDFSLKIPNGTFSQSQTVFLAPPVQFPPLATRNVSQYLPTGIGIDISVPAGEQPKVPVEFVFGLDSLSSTINQNNLILAYYDESQNLWVPVETRIDTTNKQLIGKVKHFSTFQIMQTLDSTNTGSVRVYPVPWRPYSTGNFASASVSGCGSGIIFDRLPQDAKIRIFTIAGDLIREFLSGVDGSGCLAWDGKNTSNQNIASGVYFAQITSSSGGKTIKKLAIQR